MWFMNSQMRSIQVYLPAPGAALPLPIFYTVARKTCYVGIMQEPRALMNSLLIGHILAAVACLCTMPMHAEEAGADDISSSDDDKASKTPALVEVTVAQKHDDVERIKAAKKEARRTYAILMKDEMPELKNAAGKTHHANGLELASREDNGRSVVFRFDGDGRLVRVYIGVSKSDNGLPTRTEARLRPAETFERVFGHPPVGDFSETVSKGVTGKINGGTMRWKPDWPKEVEYEGSHPFSSLTWHGSKDEVLIWDLTRGAKANLTERIAGLLQDKPVKITQKQAFAAAFESAQSLGFKVDSGKVSGPNLCYYNIADVSMDRKRWRNKNQPDVDGLSAIFGMHVSLGIAESFSRVNVMVDHQTGEVLYLGTSHGS